MKALPYWIIFRPHASDAESLAQLDDSLSRLPNNYHNWLAGDMSLPGIELPSTSSLDEKTDLK